MSVENELVRAIGREKTLALEQAFGGGRKYLARHPRPDSDIVRVIGLDAAEALGQWFGGMQVYIPRTLALIERNRVIVRDVLCGDSKTTVAQRYGLVPRTIRGICQGLDTPQVGLNARRRRCLIQGHRHERVGYPGEPDRA